jgi:acyl-homoserine-lactone acylase
LRHVLALLLQLPPAESLPPKPVAPPSAWLSLIGAYAADHDTLYVYEDGGALVALLGTAPARLAQTADSVFTFFGRGPYDADSIVFRPGEIQVGRVVLRRLQMGPADGGQLRLRPVKSVAELLRVDRGLTPPAESGAFLAPDLVELSKLDATIRLDIRYATTNNFLATVVYSSARAFLERPAALALVRAARVLRPLGYGILIHDAYRPWYVTKVFWDATPAESRWLVADPTRGSKHNRGAAVDLTLYDLATSLPVEMPSTYDEATPRALSDYPGGTSRQRWHRALLRRVLEAQGFMVNPSEWWHFDYRDWQRYPILNIPFEDIHLVKPEVSAPDRGTEILWDTYGVPHIFARSREGLAYGFGWAQMQNHGDLLLRLVAQARGRASEYLNPDYLDEDRWVWTLDLWGEAERALAAQPREMRAHLESFVSGINAFATAHPDLIGDSVRAVLPVHAVDVVAHFNRVLYARFLSGSSDTRDAVDAWRDRGSNAWAVAPRRTAGGHTLLLQNPHLPWSDLFTQIEAQYVAPGVNVSGTALVLSPVMQIAFNDNIGWTHTVNTQDGEDYYELTLSGDGYLFDGAVRAFDVQTHVLRVRQRDGSWRNDTVRVRRSVHGPVVGETSGKALALALVGLHGPRLYGAFSQWWDMGRAGNFAEFLRAIRPNQISSQNITYGDRDGHIMVFYGGNTPVRTRGNRAYWAGVVRGDSSATLWTSLHGFDDMPKTVDPPSGWVQNANDPPWWATFPVVVHPGDFPPYLATRPMALRPQQSAQLLDADSSITWDEFLRDANSTHMLLADRVLPDLLAAATASSLADVRAAAAILRDWDRRADSSSKGAVLFTEWWAEYGRRRRGQGPYAVRWSEQSPRTTPVGLADTGAAVAALRAAAESVRTRWGSLDVPWGVVHRLRRDGLDLAGSGAGAQYGVFHVVGYSHTEPDGTFSATDGASWVAAIEFTTPVHAVSIVGYGNASRAGSPHRTDQLALLAHQEFKPVWRSRADIEKHLEKREQLACCR